MRGFIKVAVTILAVAALVALIGSLATSSDERTCESTLEDLRDRTLTDQVQGSNLTSAAVDAKQREGEVFTAKLVDRCHAERWTETTFDCLDALRTSDHYDSCLGK